MYGIEGMPEVLVSDVSEQIKQLGEILTEHKNGTSRGRTQTATQFF